MDIPYKSLRVEGWPYQPHLCACDDNFIDWVKFMGFDDKYILHMGPGLHHKVGKELGQLGNVVVSLTISPDEYNNSGFLVSENYTCQLADIYEWEPADQVVKFDIVTLFHLGEMLEIGDPRPVKTLDKVIDWLTDDGRVAFYRGSSAWDRIYHLPQYEGRLQLEGISEGLEIWRKV